MKTYLLSVIVLGIFSISGHLEANDDEIVEIFDMANTERETGFQLSYEINAPSKTDENSDDWSSDESDSDEMFVSDGYQSSPR
jgi:hypothetical protein